MFSRIKGNAKACLMFEPMWVIPFSMFSTYASVYMLELGVKETQIGLITSIGLALQIFTSFISGHLTDSLGRRKALLIFDLVSWSIATFIWAISKNFWYFLIAAIVNSFQKIPNTAWYCLLVEDTDPKDRSVIFTILQVISVIAGFFAPLGGLLVNRFTLVPAVRLMYIIAFVSMTIMFFMRNKFTYETEISLKKSLESTRINFIESLKEYRDVTREIFTNKALLILFSVYILNNFQMTMSRTYLSIYLVDALKLNKALISIFPALSSIAMLLLLFFVMPRFKEENSNRYMMIGFMASMWASLTLVLTPPQNVIGVTISTIMAAVGSIVANPYLEATMANSIADNNRAKILAILTVLILVFVSPSGIIGGWTYTINPKIPFLLITLAFLMNISLMIAFIREKREKITQ
ncbi:MAG: MFS transporter [bacterium]